MPIEDEEDDKKQGFLSSLSKKLLENRKPIDEASARLAEAEELFSVTPAAAPAEEVTAERETLVVMTDPATEPEPEPELETLVSVKNPVAKPALESLVTVRNPVADPDLEAFATLTNPTVQEEELEPETDVTSILSVAYPTATPSEKVEAGEEEELFRTLGGGPTLTMTRKQKGAAAATPDTGPQERNFEDEQLSQEKMEAYHQLFAPGESPYEVLAKIIKHKNAEAGSNLERKGTNFNHRLNNIIPAVQFAVQGAKEEYRQAKAKGTATPEDLQRLQTFEHIQDMFISLKALNKNKSRYEANHYQARLAQLKSQLDQQKVDGMAQEKLRDALDEVIESNLFHKRKFYQSTGMGSTPFTAQGESFKLDDKYKKRVKIEHAENGQTVSAIFSHSRSKLLGERSHKLWKSRGGEYKEFRAQVRDFVNVSISEHNKGSASNPFNLRYIGPPQPEAALAALFEMKKRAFQEGRVIYANRDGKAPPIEIQPTSTFSDDERKLFMSFAMENPKYSRGGKLKETKTCAGYKLFRNAIEMEKPESQQDVSVAMDKFLAHELGAQRQKLDKKLDNVGDELKTVAETGAWKDNAAKQPGKFRA